MSTESRAHGFDTELLSTRIKRLLLDRIVAGEYQEGERIVELRLARELGTSQSPVREALRDLAAIGLVEILPRRGAHVRRASTKALSDVSLVRSELDALAARLAAHSIPESTLDELGGLLDEMGTCIEREDYRRMALVDAEFHGVIARASANRAIERVFSQLEPFGRTFITLSLPNVDVKEIMRQHTDILFALRQRDSDVAAEAAREHQLSVNKLLEMSAS